MSKRYDTLHDVYERDASEVQIGGFTGRMYILPTSYSVPLRVKALPHINPYAGLAVAPSTNPNIKGLGLYAMGGLSAGDVVCLFTGMWAFESDVDKAFTLTDPCIHNYSATFGKDMMVVDAATLKPNGSCRDLRVDRLTCVPRSVRGGPTQCGLVYDVRAGICDIAAVLNGASGSASPNCKLQHAIVKLPIGDEDYERELVPHAAIAVVATAPVPRATADAVAPTELLLDYGYDPANPPPAERFKSRPWDSRRYGVSDALWNVGEWFGARIDNQFFGAVTWATCGPRIDRIPCGRGATAAQGIIAYQPTGDEFVTYLRTRVINP